MQKSVVRRNRSQWSIKAAIGAACSALLVAGCSSSVEGEAVSPLYDPFRVGGLPVSDGPSGPRENAPKPDGR